MRIVYQGQLLTLSEKLGSGATADVYAHPLDDDLAFKIFTKTDCDPDRIQWLCDNPLQPSMDGDQPTFTGPIELVYDPVTGKPCGFSMRRVKGAVSLQSVKDPSNRIPEVSRPWLIRVAISFLLRLHVAHLDGFVWGDINYENVLVDRHARATLIDVDAIQFTTEDGRTYLVYRCRKELQPPELRDIGAAAVKREQDQDAWIAYTIVHALLRDGLDPFDFHFVGPGARPPLDEVIRCGIWAESGRHPHFRPKRNARPFTSFPKTLQNLLRQMFDVGHADRGARPTVTDLLACLTLERRFV